VSGSATKSKEEKEKYTFFDQDAIRGSDSSVL